MIDPPPDLRTGPCAVQNSSNIFIFNEDREILDKDAYALKELHGCIIDD